MKTKVILVPILLLSLTSCSTVRDLNYNLNETTDAINYNTGTVQRSTQAIRRNAQLVDDSTRTIQENQRLLEAAAAQ